MLPGEISTSHPVLPFGFDKSPCDHAVLFYLDENFLIRVLCDFVAASLHSGQSAVILATVSHHRSIAHELASRGFDLPPLIKTQRYTELDAEKVLSVCLVSGQPDIARLDRIISEALTLASAETCRIMVYGELVALLWAQRNLAGVLAVEEFWNRLAKRFSFTLLCGYPIREFDRKGTEDSYLKICGTHTTIIPPDAYPSPQSEKRLTNSAALSRS